MAKAPLGVRGEARYVSAMKSGAAVAAEFAWRASATGVQKRPKLADGSHLFSVVGLNPASSSPRARGSSSRA